MWLPPDHLCACSAEDADADDYDCDCDGPVTSIDGAGLRVAVLVFPSYDEARTPLAALEGSQLLPGKLTSLPHSVLMRDLGEMLRGHGYIVYPMCQVTKRRLKSLLLTLARAQPEVMAVVFCGHGSPAREQREVGRFNPHGVMQLNGCTSWTADDMSGLLERCGFTGTLITFLNMGQPPKEPAYRWALFSSCTHGTTQLPTHAALMVRLFVKAAGTSYSVMCESWPGLKPIGNDEIAASLLMQPFCMMGGDYKGTFPGPA